MNILDNASFGRGTTLDLCFRQESTQELEYQGLTHMWGEPEAKNFCFREPAGYMASARKKLPGTAVTKLQTNYVRAFDTYDRLGGRIIEYSDIITKNHYIEFLAPVVAAMDIERLGPEVVFRGRYAPDLVTIEMPQAYRDFCARYRL